MHKFTVGFSNTRIKMPLISWLIKYIEDTEFSHVYIKFHSDKLNRDLIYHSSAYNVHFMNIDSFNEHCEIYEEYELEVNFSDYYNVMLWCVDNVGKPYGWKELVGVGIARVFKLKVNPLGDDDRTQICTETVANVLELLGHKFDKDMDNIGLKEIYNKVKNLGKRV